MEPVVMPLTWSARIWRAPCSRASSVETSARSKRPPLVCTYATPAQDTKPATSGLRAKAADATASPPGL